MLSMAEDGRYSSCPTAQPTALFQGIGHHLDNGGVHCSIKPQLVEPKQHQAEGFHD